MTVPTREGEVPFDLPQADYTLPIAELTERTGIPTIFYDQFGNGKSTHVPERKGDESFFTVDIFKSELDNLVDHLKLQKSGFSLLGHSWGGMLAAEYAVDHHADSGLRKIIISNSPASMKSWGEAATRLRALMPEVDKVLKKCEAEGRTEGDQEYEAASAEFYKKYMNGPNEFYVIGNLRTWDVTPQLPKITVETLLINGEYDEAADSTVAPFFEGIKKVKWRTLGGCSHMSYCEDLDKYLETVHSFLA
ncbi:MAG: hypothetical protein Q9162_001929 [Coniocarpon cinnabarinum]